MEPSSQLPLNTELQGPTFFGQLPRRETASSVGSYTDLPPGRWLLHFHGSCSRCHHYHKSVKVKVHVTQDATKINPIHCENCKEYWLAFGGRNATRISLLSSVTMQPDPVEKEVRSALIQMVQIGTTASAIASPNLGSTLNTSSQRQSGSRSVSFHIPPRGAQKEESAATGSSQNGHTLADDSHPAYDSIKQRIRSRLGRMRLSFFQGSSRSPKLSNIGVDQTSVDHTQANGEPMGVFSTSESSTTLNTEQSIPRTSFQEICQSDSLDLPYGSVEAAEFIATLQNDHVESMNDSERRAWMRQKLTEFKAHRARYRSTKNMSDAGTQLAPMELLHPDSIEVHGHHALDLLHMGSVHHTGHHGSHQGWFDRCWPNDRPLSVSDRISEAQTAVDDTSTAASQPRFSLLEHWRRERNRSLLSLRPTSASSTPWSLQNIRQRNSARLSLDSATSAGAVRSVSTGRGRSLHRRSRGSMARISTHGLPELSPAPPLPHATEERSNEDSNTTPEPTDEVQDPDTLRPTST